MVTVFWSSDYDPQLEATTKYRKLLSTGINNKFVSLGFAYVSVSVSETNCKCLTCMYV